MLMGVRVYNPVTNQFTSVDAVSGGNESPYGYPNDPVNKNDFSGLAAIDKYGMFWVGVGLSILESAGRILGCFKFPGACAVISAFVGAAKSVLYQIVDLTWGPGSDLKCPIFCISNVISDAAFGAWGSSAIQRGIFTGSSGRKIRNFLVSTFRDAGLNLIFNEVNERIFSSPCGIFIRLPEKPRVRK
jgi:hypothetical protein